jgi:hypothetical protein
MTTVNTPGSMRKERSASAAATVIFDGNTLVDGASNFPFPRHSSESTRRSSSGSAFNAFGGCASS